VVAGKKWAAAYKIAASHFDLAATESFTDA